MASVPKLLLLLLCSYHTFVAHAGGDRSYKLLSIGSLNSDSVCSQPKGAALSEHAMRDFIWLFLCAVVIDRFPCFDCFSDSIVDGRHGAFAPPARPMLTTALQEDAGLGGDAPA